MCPKDVLFGMADAMHHKTIPPPPVCEGRGLAVPGVFLRSLFDVSAQLPCGGQKKKKKMGGVRVHVEG